MKIKPMLRRFAAWIASAARRFWQVLSRRFWMKLLSLALAILVWNYVVSSVIICVIIPILVYVELIYAIIKSN